MSETKYNLNVPPLKQTIYLVPTDVVSKTHFKNRVAYSGSKIQLKWALPPFSQQMVVEITPMISFHIFKYFLNNMSNVYTKQHVKSNIN